MRTTTFPLLLTGLLAPPALAHPGHGLPGWLHHGEVLIVAAVVLTAVVARARRRGDDR